MVCMVGEMELLNIDVIKNYKVGKHTIKYDKTIIEKKTT